MSLLWQHVYQSKITNVSSWSCGKNWKKRKKNVKPKTQHNTHPHNNNNNKENAALMLRNSQAHQWKRNEKGSKYFNQQQLLDFYFVNSIVRGYSCAMSTTKSVFIKIFRTRSEWSEWYKCLIYWHLYAVHYIHWIKIFAILKCDRNSHTFIQSGLVVCLTSHWLVKNHFEDDWIRLLFEFRELETEGIFLWWCSYIDGFVYRRCWIYRAFISAARYWSDS